MDREFRLILAEFLKENRLSQSDFARQIGVKPGLINDWMRGKAKPAYDSLRTIVQVFGVPAEYFLGLTDDY